MKHTTCSPDLELLCVQFRPFYLPWELCCVVLIIVYIPPCGNKKKAEEDIATIARDIETSKPDAPVIILGDFNGASSINKPGSKDDVWHYTLAFNKLPSGWRVRQPRARTSRFRNSFIPNVISLLNSSWWIIILKHTWTVWVTEYTWLLS